MSVSLQELGFGRASAAARKARGLARSWRHPPQLPPRRVVRPEARGWTDKPALGVSRPGCSGPTLRSPRPFTPRKDRLPVCSVVMLRSPTTAPTSSRGVRKMFRKRQSETGEGSAEAYALKGSGNQRELVRCSVRSTATASRNLDSPAAQPPGRTSTAQ